MNARVPIGLPPDWFYPSPLDFAFGITSDPSKPANAYYPRNPSGWFYNGPITTLARRRPGRLRTPEWKREKAKRRTAKASKRRNRS
jgi:hypothetical protein